MEQREWWEADWQELLKIFSIKIINQYQLRKIKIGNEEFFLLWIFGKLEQNPTKKFPYSKPDNTF